MTIQNYPDELDYVNAKLSEVARGSNPNGFLETFFMACLCADNYNYELLRPALRILIAKYPPRMDRLRMENQDRGVDV